MISLRELAERGLSRFYGQVAINKCIFDA